MSTNTLVINNPPDPSRIMSGLRDTGYDFNTAIADIIDNSIAAGANAVYITVEADPSMNVFVSIADDGCGMDFDGLKNAMRYGSESREDPSSLGKFGLGLKTASTAFCRKLSVISRASYGAYPIKVCWDLDHVAAKNAWELLKVEPTKDDLELLDQAASGRSGTLVTWENVDRLFQREYKRTQDAKKALTRYINGLRDHIALVYQRFLDFSDDRGRNVNIILNDEEVEPFDPFCTGEEKTRLVAEVPNLGIGYEDTADEDLATMQLRAYVLPPKVEFSTQEAASNARISNDNQGFYIYRENRLIHSGDWMDMFKIEPHFTLLRVELSFDHLADEFLHVDIKKSRILLDEQLSDYIQNEFLPAPRREADERYRQDKKRGVARSSNEAHKPADRTISNNASGAEASRITDIDAGRGEATVENKNGVVRSRVVIRARRSDGMTRVNLVDRLDHGELWAPSILEGNHAVAISKAHDFYQKVYYPLLDDQKAIIGLDCLLWALAEAEHSSFTEDSKEYFLDMRLAASRALEKLLADQPDADVD